RTGDHRRRRSAHGLLRGAVHGDRRALRAERLGGGALDPARRLRGVAAGRPHGVLAAWSQRDRTPRREPAARVSLHGRGQLRHIDPVRLLVTGAAGMLGHDVRRAAARSRHELVLADLPAPGMQEQSDADRLLGLDITDGSAVEGLLGRLHGEAGSLAAIVNCAAWTDVDGAESKRDSAHAVNAAGAGVLARAAADLDIPLLHISTDYVFDGVAPLDAQGRPRPYVESDQTGPRSVYGATKLDGERQVLGASARHTVVRTAWLYGTDGSNFVETMLRLAGERDAVQVVTDQLGSPTWGGHLAPALLGLLEREVRGLVHMTG